MERSLASLTYKGSIPEAINEAKKQKKLLLVYISGEGTDSTNLENSTWNDVKVAESVSKYCILLHVPGGSTDAANFCAIYPQNSIPCITAVGYNGVQVWKSEGFVSAEVLASSLEKAWLSLHIQETTATVLTAALASNKSEPATSGTSVVESSEQGSSSGAAVPSPLMEKHLQSSEARSPAASAAMVKENNTEPDVKTSSKSFSDSRLGGVRDEQSTSSSKEAENLLTPAEADPENSQAEPMDFSSPGPGSTAENHSSVPIGGPTEIPAEVDKVVESERADEIDCAKVDALGSSNRVSESTDVHLNIRLPNGVSLREKFSLTNTLGTVKDYVDRNQSGISSYDLAVPYPRRIFTDEDLSKSLSELSLFNRHALIVVPRQKASGYHGGGPSPPEQISSRTIADSSNASEGGYFASIKRLLSYANPLSYLSGGASSSGSRQDSQTGIWEYGPNPTLQNNLAAGARPSLNQGTSSGRNGSKNRPATTSRIGSNIHTLKHDEDDSRFSDRNAFWNGNSTQYGGDNNGR